MQRQNTGYSGTLLGVHFQSPRRNLGVGSMWNAPWPVGLANFFIKIRKDPGQDFQGSLRIIKILARIFKVPAKILKDP